MHSVNNTTVRAQTVKPANKTASRDRFKIFLKWLYVLSLTIYGCFLIDSLDYCLTPYQQRPYHEAYEQLRPAGFRGQGFGVIGAAMLSFMLLYSLRKRVRLFRKWGSLSRWLDIHIYLGIMGPLFIILHSSFKVQGLVALSFWSMIAVAGSGIVGRYLYLQIPRNRRGDELSLSQILSLDERFSRDIQETLQLDPAAIAQLDRLIAAWVGKKRGLLISSLRMALNTFLRPWQIYRLRKVCAKELLLREPFLRRTVHFAWHKITLKRRMMLLNQVRQLFHYWHMFHKPFATIMYLIMIIHIGVAVWLGYTWIF